MNKQNKVRKKRVGRDKLSSEKVKKVTINMPETDVENVSFVAKLQGKTTSAFIRDVLKFAVELEIGKREIFIFNEEKQSMEKLKIDITYFYMEFQNSVSHLMRETMGIVNQGYISIDELTEMPEPFWGTGDAKTDDNTYLCLLISASKEKKIRFWSKQRLHESVLRKEDELVDEEEERAPRTLEKDFKEAWGGVVPTPAKLSQEEYEKTMETIAAAGGKNGKV